MVSHWSRSVPFHEGCFLEQAESDCSYSRSFIPIWIADPAVVVTSTIHDSLWDTTLDKNRAFAFLKINPARTVILFLILLSLENEALAK